MGARCSCQEGRDEDETVLLPGVPDRQVCAMYDYTKSTEDNHGVAHFTGIHKDIRPLLDYTYHRKYSAERADVQDRIIEKLCSATPLHSEMLPWVVFTAGAMGAGKGFVTRWMHDQGFWNLDYFVRVDPDEIRHELPEWNGYVQHNPEKAGDLTQKEAGCIAEILSYKALRARKNVIIDGSLRDATWYREYFQRLRREFPGIRIMLLHVVADLEDVLQHAAERAERTGRTVPREKLMSSAREVPESVKALAGDADFACRVLNGRASQPVIQREESAPHPLASVAVSWELVTQLWRPIDTDGDGQLAADELQAAITDGLLTQAVVRTMDKDGDGKISKHELMMAAMTALNSGTKHYR